MRRYALYLGTNPTHYKTKYTLLHSPIIEIIPKLVDDFFIQDAIRDFEEYTHVILTSQHTVHILFKYLHQMNRVIKDEKKVWVCVGRTTALTLKSYVQIDPVTAKEETQDGIIDLISLMHLESSYLFIPKSSRARSSLDQFLRKMNIRHKSCDLYDVSYKKFVINFDAIKEIIFTSPSTVDAFFEGYQEIPRSIQVVSIGSITQEYLKLKGYDSSCSL